MLRSVFLFSVALLFLVPIAAASQAAGQTNPITITADKGSPSAEQHAPGSIEEEMRAKRAIRYAENEHRDNLERARELSQLGSKIANSFKTKQSLDRDDFKRLDRLEKLAKQLRSKAGGSDTETSVEKRPNDLKEAVNRLADTADSLSKLVEKTPRQVISTSLIDEANVLLELIDLVREMSKK